MYACALGNVYTFGPTFRAENSNTARHLAEFWMIEPEMAFADLNDDMACAEAYLKHCVAHVLQHCQEDLAFFDGMVEKGLIQRLQVSCCMAAVWCFAVLKSHVCNTQFHADCVLICKGFVIVFRLCVRSVENGTHSMSVSSEAGVS